MLEDLWTDQEKRPKVFGNVHRRRITLYVRHMDAKKDIRIWRNWEGIAGRHHLHRNRPHVRPIGECAWTHIRRSSGHHGKVWNTETDYSPAQSWEKRNSWTLEQNTTKQCEVHPGYGQYATRILAICVGRHPFQTQTSHTPHHGQQPVHSPTMKCPTTSFLPMIVRISVTDDNFNGGGYAETRFKGHVCSHTKNSRSHLSPDTWPALFKSDPSGSIHLKFTYKTIPRDLIDITHAWLPFRTVSDIVLYLKRPGAAL